MLEQYGKIGIISFLKKLMQTKKGWINLYYKIDLTEQDRSKEEE